MSRIFAYYMLFLSSLFSQDLKQLQGFVEDQTSGRIAGAKVLLRSETTNRTAHTITADDGSFRFQNVPAGKSRIRVEHPGFETVDQDSISSLLRRSPSSFPQAPSLNPSR